MSLKKIDFESGKLTGKSGKEYLIESELSVVRFQEFEKLQSHVGFGVDFEGVINKLKDAFEDLNKSKPADAAIKIHNLLNGVIQKVENREHPIMEMCALFINSEDEDRTEFNVDKIKRKIEDWREYSTNDFFQLAFTLVNNFIPIYEEISQSISKQGEKKKKSTTENK